MRDSTQQAQELGQWVWELAGLCHRGPAASSQTQAGDALKVQGSLAPGHLAKSQGWDLLLFQRLYVLPPEMDFSSGQTASLLPRWLQSLLVQLPADPPSVASPGPSVLYSVESR